MSLTDRKKKASRPAKATKRQVLRRIALGFLFIIAVITAIVWIQRYTLIENYARSKLAAQGIDAGLSLQKISKSRAVIENIHFSSDNKSFFSAKKISVDYNWREALNLKFSRVEVTKPELMIDVDETGKIISEWLPTPGNQGAPGVSLPTDGVKITDGAITLNSPFGTFAVDAEADIRSETDMSAFIIAPPQDLTYGEFKGRVGINLDMKISGNEIYFDVISFLPSWRYADIFGTQVSMNWKGTLPKERFFETVNSTLEARFKTLVSPDVSLRNGLVTWDGDITAPTDTGGSASAKGIWSANIGAASLTNNERRKRLAASVTLNDMLMNISASAPFAPGLTGAVDGLLKDSAVQASGQINVNEGGLDIYLDGPVQTRGQRNTLKLSPVATAPFFSYEREAGALRLSFNGSLAGPYAASLENTELLARIKDGRNLSNIESFRADLATQQTWRARTKAGRPVRLAPLKAKVSYDASKPVRRVKLIGSIDYDGEVPGAYVEDLKARGALSLSLTDTDMSAQFTPFRGAGIKIARLETPSDWVIKQAVFDLASTAPQYWRGPKRSRVTAQISQGRGELTHQSEPQSLMFELPTADISGDIDANIQDWIIIARDIDVTSDNFPSAGTEIKAAEAVLTARLQLDKPITFTIESPAADVKTTLVSAVGLPIAAEGKPNDLDVLYGPGRITFTSGQLPVLPLTGDITYQDGVWTGAAVTTLPKSNSTPINIVYRFANGTGSASVDITDLPFSPSRLQPQSLISALRGKISRVEGLVSVNIDLSYTADTPLTSSGTATIKNMNAGTLPGPFYGLNGDLKFSSFFPLQTDGQQKLTLDKFDPGLPLENGELLFEIIPDGVKIDAAKWPLGSGQISLDPTIWRYTATQNKVSLRVQDVSLGEFLKNVGGGKLKATGDVSGVFPVVIEGVKVHVQDGKLSVKDGGLIQYTSPQTDAAGSANEYAGMAFEALKNFKYEELEASLNGPLDGAMSLRMKFGGSNPEVLYGTEFKFNVGIEGELLNILRSFKMGDTISSKIIEDIQAHRESTSAQP